MIRTRIYFSFILLVATGATTVRAQEPVVHPIEKALEACIDKNGSTAGMVTCEDRAYALWDKELNKNYLALLAKLPAAVRPALKAAQLEWLKYRDSEFKLIDSVYESLQGTMFIPMHVDRRKEVIRGRAEELAHYLELLSENEP